MERRADSARTDARRAGVARRALAAAVFAWLAVAVAPAAAQASPDLAPCIPDGTVRAITHANGNTFIGGQFDAVGERSGSGVALGAASIGGSTPSPLSCGPGTDPESSGGTPASGQPARPFPEVSGGEVDAVIPDGQGGWYIGGTFTSVGDQPRDRLAHIRDGSVLPGVGDPNAPGGGNGIECPVVPVCAVRTLALDPGGSSYPDGHVLYAGGSFDGVGSSGNLVTPTSNLAALYTDDSTGASTAGTAVPSTNDWSPPTPDGAVNALAVVPITIDVAEATCPPGITASAPNVCPVPMSVVVTAGSFSNVNSTDGIHGLTAVWGVGAVQSCGACTPASLPSDSTPTSMGGAFVQESSGTTPSNPLDAWNPVSSPPSNPSFRALTIGQPLKESGAPGTTCPSATQTCEYVPVYVGGMLPVASNPPNPTQAFQLPIITGELPSSYSSTQAAKLPGEAASKNAGYPNWSPAAALSDTATCDSTGAGSVINAVAVSPQPTRSQLTSPGSTPPTTAPVVYLGGDFPTQAGGTGPCSPTYVASVTGIMDPSNTQSTTTPWSPAWNTGVGGHINGPVNALVVGPSQSSNLVYVGGDFTHPDCDGNPGLTCNYAAAFPDVHGGTDPIPDWTPGLAGGPVNALAISDSNSQVYAGGSFESTGSAPRSNLAAIDPSGSLLPWNPGASSSSPSPCAGVSSNQVDALAASASTIFVGGVFDTLGGAGLCNLGAVDASSGAPVSGFSPNPNDAVLALSDTGNALYVGGRFTQIGGQSRSGLAKLDPGSGAVDAQWTPNPVAHTGPTPASVDAINADCGVVYIGGDFASVGGKTRDDLAALDPSSGAPTVWNPDATSYVYAIQPAENVVYVAGGFPNAGGGGGPYVAAIDSSTGKASPNFYSAAHYSIPALAITGSTLYEGQAFGGAGGNGGVQNLLAVQGNSAASTWGQPLDTDINPSSGVNSDSPFNPYTSGYPDPDSNNDNDVPGPGGDVLALSAYGHTLYLGGDFTSLGTSPQQGLAAIPLASEAGTGAVTCKSPSPPPAVQISGGPANFGNQAIHTASSPHAFTVTNVGGSGLTIPAGGVALAGADASQYLVSHDGCSGQTLAANGGTCSVQVSFMPTTPGSHNRALLQLTDNASGSPQTVALAGTGVVVAARHRPPVLRRFRQSHRRWQLPVQRRAHKHPGKPPKSHRKRIPTGTKFSFWVSERAKVYLMFTQTQRGKLARHHRCVAPTGQDKHKPICRRTVIVGTITVRAKRGTNHLTFTGVLPRRRKLRPGIYTVSAIAVDSFGESSAVRKLRFKITG